MINRRQFVSSAAAASTASLLAQQSYEWGGPVLDIHLHLRADGESNFTHIEGSGVIKAVLLTRVQSVNQSRARTHSDSLRDVPQVSGNAVFNGGFKRFHIGWRSGPPSTVIGEGDSQALCCEPPHPNWLPSIGSSLLPATDFIWFPGRRFHDNDSGAVSAGPGA